MPWLQDFFSRPIRFFREKTAGVLPEYKGNYGVEITNQSSTTGDYTLAKQGDEQGWAYNEGTSQRGFGSWAQTTPAIWNKTDATIKPAKDKTLAVDNDYESKTPILSAGDSANQVRIAKPSYDKTVIPGIISSCLNHESQEQIFIPIDENTLLSQITSPADSTTGGVQPYSWSGDGTPCVIKCKNLADITASPPDILVLLKYHGKSGYPTPSMVQNNQLLAIHYAGALTGVNGVGWVAFVSEETTTSSAALAIKDLGTGSGIPVAMSSGAWVEYGTAKSLIYSGGSSFHGSPFRAGNIYVGLDVTSGYLVSRVGYGDEAKTFSVYISGTTYTLSIDAAGKVRSFT